jgi:putative ABC transport system permease protein
MTLKQDIRHAVRMARRQPAFSLLVILTLGIGIGANAAVFSVVNSVLLKSLPFPASDRLVAVWGRFDPESGFNFPRFPLSPPEFVDYRQQSRAFEDVSAWSHEEITVGGPGAEPERVAAAAVSANMLSLLRVAPALGRGFTSDEDRPGGAPVALLGNTYWQTRFGGDPSIVGRTVPMNGVSTTIVGVMPPGFTYPGATTRIWVPIQIDPKNPGNRKAHSIRAVGRLAPSVSFDTARAELQTIMAAWKAQYPDIHTGHYLFIRPLLDDVAGSVRPALVALLAATGFVLLIVCANVASLLLARAEARTREMAIRGALGAGRARLVRLTLMESGVLSLAGGLLGVVFAQVAVRALLQVDPSSIPRSTEIGVDARMLAFAAALSLVSALLFGLVPALRGASPALQETLRESSQSTTAGIGRQLARKGLVAIEVALGIVLVLGATLMVRSFDRLLSVERGFQPCGVLMANVDLPVASYKDDARVETFYDTLLTRVRAVPGVQAASAASGVPMWSDIGVWDFEIEGRPEPRAGETAWNAAIVVARGSYFDTLRIPLVRGRVFSEHDDVRSMPVAIVNEAMAARFFNGEDPIGRRIRVKGVASQDAWMTVVGIVRDIRDEGLDLAPRPTYYLSHAQTPVTQEGAYRSMTVLLRVMGKPEAIVPAVRAAVRELDPTLPVFDVQTVDAVIDQSIARPRFTTVLLGLFAVIGAVLGASGIYGVLSYTVARRTQELGIRRALGAPAGRLVTDIILRGMQPVGLGLIAGVLGSFWATRLLTTELFGISPTDPSTYVLASVAVLLVALAACVIPARRALHISPISALRSE